MMTTKLDEKIKKLEEELKAAKKRKKATETAEARKRRNSELFALGVFLEKLLQNEENFANNRIWMEKKAKRYLDERMSARVHAAFERLNLPLTAPQNPENESE